MKKISISLLLSLFMSFVGTGFCYAQKATVSGTVLNEEKEPIVGATVLIKGTVIGTVTGPGGAFTIQYNIEDGNQLVISCVGMQTQEVTFSPNTRLEIVLKEDSYAMEDVVIQVAYGTAKKIALTGAVQNIEAADIEQRPVSSVGAVLEGMGAGIQVNNTFAQPGNDATVRIRGFSTVTGSNSPLYVVDGSIFYGNISDMNPNDIESISVLKDATSASLYGNKASNGVILITTKKGTGSEQLSVRLNINQGIYTRGIGEYAKVGSDEYMENYFAYYRNGLYSSGAYSSLEEATAFTRENLISEALKYNIYNKKDNELFDANGKLVSDAYVLPQIAEDLNWFDGIERIGYRQDYTISASASSKKSSIYISAGYLDENGYVNNAGFQRFTGRASGDISPRDYIKVGLSVAGSHQITDWTDGDGSGYTNPFSIARYMAPIYPVYKHYLEDVYDDSGELLYAKGDYVLDSNGNKIYDDGSEYSRPSSLGRHMIWENELNQDRTYRNTLTSTAYVDLKFLKDFTFTLKGDISLRNSENRTYTNAEIGDSKDIGTSSRYIYRYKTYTLSQQLMWAHKFNLHSLDALVSHEAFKNNYSYLSATKRYETYAGKIELINFSEMRTLTDYQYTYTTESYLGRVRYNYDEKWFAEASFRRDGSSKFYTGHKWGNFYSAGASWIVSREKFMDNAPWIDLLKIRAAYGQAGNDSGTGYYDYMALYGSTLIDSQIAAYKTNNEALDLTWESSNSFDVGIDMTLFNRLNITIDYFNKVSKDLLFSVNQPLSAGATSNTSAQSTVMTNMGSVANRGLEVSLGMKLLETKNWRWDFDINATYMKNKILSLPSEYKEDGYISGSYRYMEGKSFYTLYLNHWEGVDMMNGRSLYTFDDTKYYTQEQLDAGTVTQDMIDANGLSLVEDSEDYVMINGKAYAYNTTYGKKHLCGTALPTVYGSFSTSLSWKNLSMKVLCTYSLGGKLYASSYSSMMTLLSPDLRKAWTAVPEGMTETSEDRINANIVPQLNSHYASYNNATSDRWLLSRSYFVLKNIALSYRFPEHITRKLNIGSLAINASVENLLTCTAMKGLNPQQNFSGTSSDVMPTARVFTVGLNLGF